MPSKVCKTDYVGTKRHRHHRSKKGKRKLDHKQLKSPRYKLKKGKILEEETLAEFRERVAFMRFKMQQ